MKVVPFWTRIFTAGGSVLDEGFHALTAVEKLGELIPLCDLPAQHPALTYVQGHGYDPAELAQVWQVGYCQRASFQYPCAQDRIIIPIIRNGVWVGWQARYPGERKWVLEHLPKYITMPGMQKRLVLYNHDVARQQACVVVCEGTSDVWRSGCGRCGIAGQAS